ncbi:phosphotransferase family protein [Gordonia humi]|uniref:Aminoglycoside phosphotransferase (APT) family kinase protein n=1 Tax=Gordonia humi TaxID=686429 RepID=A0A840EXP7_9ACTN|nr:phosphotransferase family protein [Gordonia humi]MBB4135118.1 aminoglycoside phosphotransferase (APT) family kinase protein [Gordonia humi]
MSYTPTRGDLGGNARDLLLAWLPERIAPGGSGFAISDFSSPDAGYSGKTVFFTADWTNAEGGRAHEDLVLRLQASEHQLFTEPDAPRQAEIMELLKDAPGVEVPEIVLIERSSAVLGAPFYLMRRTIGRTPSDVPSWHKRGWTTELTAQQRTTMFDNALRSLVAVHAVDAPETIEFLRKGADPSTSALTRYLADLREWYEWARDDIIVGTDTLATAYRVIMSTAPETDHEGVVWGDARVGNMAFADDMSVTALYDWETATTGPAEIDLGWWLMFEEFLCEGLSFSRPSGIPDSQGTVARYRELGGCVDDDITYYKLVAAFVLSLINNRLAALLTRDGLDPEIAHSYPVTSVELTSKYLAELSLGELS